MKRKKLSIAWYYVLLIALVVITLVAAPLSARYLKRTDKVTNDFTPAGPTSPTIEEEFDDEVKTDVYVDVGATGYPVFVRAAIVITWKDANGIVYFRTPVKNVDYTIVLDTSNGWKEGEDGYYYYTKPVESGGKTSVLIKECKYAPDAIPPEGYTLSVEILAQTIQAIGSTDETEIPAYQDAWGLSQSLGEN